MDALSEPHYIISCITNVDAIGKRGDLPVVMTTPYESDGITRTTPSWLAADIARGAVCTQGQDGSSAVAGVQRIPIAQLPGVGCCIRSRLVEWS